MIDMLDAIGKGFSATEIVWDSSEREWFPRALAMARPALVHVRLGLGRGTAGAHAEERRQIPVAGERKRGSGAFQGRRTLRRVARRHRDSADDRAAGALQIHRHFAKAKAGLPIRGGLARAAGWSYLFKNYVLKDWVTFAEVFGQPLRVGKYGPGATEQDKQALLQAVCEYWHRCRGDHAGVDGYRIHRGAAERQRGALSELLRSISTRR